MDEAVCQAGWQSPTDMKLVLGMFAVAAFAAEGTKVWSSADLMKRLSTAKTDSHKITGTSLESFNGYRLSVFKREANGLPELHQKVDDVFVVESGEAILVTGGTITGAKSAAPNEVRGQSIQGGTKRKLATGDFVRIPANVPHQFLVDEGKQITYAVMKVDAR